MAHSHKYEAALARDQSRQHNGDEYRGDFVNGNYYNGESFGGDRYCRDVGSISKDVYHGSVSRDVYHGSTSRDVHYHEAQSDGVSINDELIRASATGNAELVKDLIGDGAHVNYADEHGWMPLHHAVCGNDVETVRVLLAFGARVRVKFDPNRTPTSSPGK